MYTPHSCTGGVLINLQWLKHHKHHKLDLQVAQTRQTGPAVAHFAEAARALQQLLKGSQGATRRRSKSERGARDRRSLGERRTESLRARC